MRINLRRQCLQSCTATNTNGSVVLSHDRGNCIIYNSCIHLQLLWKSSIRANETYRLPKTTLEKSVINSSGILVWNIEKRPNSLRYKKRGFWKVMVLKMHMPHLSSLRSSLKAYKWKERKKRLILTWYIKEEEQISVFLPQI